MDTLTVITNLAQQHRFVPHVNPDGRQPTPSEGALILRKDRTRRTRGVRAVSGGFGSSWGIIQLVVTYKGPDVWVGRGAKHISLCEPDSLERLNKWFKKAK